MKSSPLLLLMMILHCFVKAQAPYLINYQGVALRANGTPLANTSIKIKLGITTGSSTSLSYNEERLVTTDAGGLFDVQIGSPGF